MVEKAVELLWRLSFSHIDLDFLGTTHAVALYA